MRSFSYPGPVHNSTPDRIVFGPGSFDTLRDEVRRLDRRHALIVSTPGRRELAERAAEILGDHCVGILDEAISQVPIELAVRGRARADESGADCLVSVGGGASIGLGKGIALGHPLPIVAVPTTYSGSEMTGFCGITDGGIKRMHASTDMLATTVLYDASLTLSLPVSTTASSAFNALAHCVDGPPVPTLSPLLAHNAIEGLQTILASLPAVLEAPDDLEARNELLYGSYLAGAVLSGGFAVQHAIAHVLGGTFGIEHGLAHAVILPHVTRHLEQRGTLQAVQAAVGTSDLGGVLFELLRDVGLPTRLSELGLTGGDLERAEAIASGHDADTNEDLDQQDARAVGQILRAAYAGHAPSTA